MFIEPISKLRVNRVVSAGAADGAAKRLGTALLMSLIFFCLFPEIRADVTILTQGFETNEGDGWSLSLGANSTGTQVKDGTAYEGDAYVQFTLGENEYDGEGNLTDYSSAAVFGQRVWESQPRLDRIFSTMQVRGEFSSYMTYQVVPDKDDLDNQFFIVGGNLQGGLSTTEWTTFSAGQNDSFHVARYLGNKFAAPGVTPGNRKTLAEICEMPLLLEADGSDTGLTWGDAIVRWVSPQAGFGGGYNPAQTTDLDGIETGLLIDAIRVDDDWAGAVNGDTVSWFEGGNYTYGLDAFSSLTDAINSNTAADGDTVMIAPGLYLESDVYISKELTIRGMGTDPSAVVFAPDQDSDSRSQPWDVAPYNNWPASSRQCLIIHADNIIIENLTIDGSAAPEREMDYHLGITSDFRTAASYGIDGVDCDNVVIRDVEVRNCFRRGIQIRAFSRQLTGWVIDNAVTEDMKGYFDWEIDGDYNNEQNIGIVSFGAVAEIKNSTARRCGTGIATGSTGVGSGNVKINDNTVSGCRIAYQFVGVGPDAEFSDNTAVIDNNPANAIAEDGIGLVIWEFVGSTTLARNSFSGSGLLSGIQILSQNQTPENCIIEDNVIIGADIADSVGIEANNNDGTYGNRARFTIDGVSINNFATGISLANGKPEQGMSEIVVKQATLLDNGLGIRVGENTKLTVGESAASSINVNGGIIFEDGSAMDWDIDLADYNAVKITGDLTVNANTDLDISGTAAPGNSYQLLSFSGSRNGTFNSATVPAGWDLVHDDDAKIIFLREDAKRIDSIAPNFGPTAGGTAVTIYGSGVFDPGATVSFGGVPATNVVVLGDNKTITCTAPAKPAGAVDVVVSDGDETSLVRGYTYVENQFSVAFLSGGNGRVEWPTFQTVNEGDSTAPVSVIPDKGYHFVGWSGNHEGFENPLTINNVTQDMTITANFANSANSAYLTMAASGNGSVDPEGTFAVLTGENIDITATPDADNTFVRWSIVGNAIVDDIRSANAKANLSDDAELIAVFAADDATVELTVLAGANGAVDPDGTVNVIRGQLNNIAATPDEGYRFSHWSITAGTATVSDAEQAATSVRLTENATVTANFAIENNPPIIADQAFVMDEAAPDGWEVGNVVASDPDGDSLTFLISSGNDDGVFAIDAASGMISVADNSSVSFDDTPAYALRVQVSDGNATAAATITVAIADLATNGILFVVEAKNVDIPLILGGGVMNEFFRRPRITAHYTDPLRGRDSRTNIRIHTRVPAADGSAVTELSCEWTRSIPLYDKRALSMANREGTFTSTWLAANPIADLNCTLRIATELADRSRFEVALAKPLLVTPPEITSVENWNGNPLGDVQTSSIAVIKGKYFGSRAPTVWLEYLDARGQVKKQRLKVQRIYEYNDARGRENSSPMDLDSGISGIRVEMPKKWWKDWTPGNYDLVIDNRTGIAVDEISTVNNDANNAPDISPDNFDITPGERSYQLDILANDSDPQSDNVKMIFANRGITDQGGRVVQDAKTGKVRYTPPRDGTLPDAFEYSLDDGHSDEADWPAMVNVNIRNGEE